MLALLYPAHDRLEMADQPLPEAGPGEVVLRVAACGICGSELEAFKHRSPRRPPPLVMGHEFCGVVAQVGDGVEGLVPEQRVVSNSVIPCGTCLRCRRGDTHLCGTRQIFGMKRPGAFATHVPVPARCLLPWPDGLPAEAACLAEPLGNGVHVANLTRHLPAETVLVIGAGPIGLMCQQALQAMRGATVWVADLVPERLDVARSVGAEQVFNGGTEDLVQRVLALTDGEGVDLVVDAAGTAATKQQALAAARAGGAVVWIGLHENAMTLDSFGVTLPEKRILGSYAVTMDELGQALDLMVTGKVETASWVQPFPLAHGVEAFHRMLAAQGRDIKAVLVP